MSTESVVLISHPERQSTAQRTIFGALTCTIWAVWIYLWLPLVTALLWIAGIHSAYIQIFNAKRGIGLGVVFWIALVTIVLVAYWSNYNRIRYADSTRRQRAPAVLKVEIGEKFGVTEPATLSLLLEQSRLNLYFDDSGQLIQVSIPEKSPTLSSST